MRLNVLGFFFFNEHHFRSQIHPKYTLDIYTAGGNLRAVNELLPLCSLASQEVVLQQAGGGVGVGGFYGTNILRGRMREVSLLPSSLRLDLLLSASGFSLGSSSDWPPVALSQALL